MLRSSAELHLQRGDSSYRTLEPPSWRHTGTTGVSPVAGAAALVAPVWGAAILAAYWDNGRPAHPVSCSATYHVAARRPITNHKPTHPYSAPAHST